jgi:imidazolonepropionase-like amidohydrolase
MRTLGILALLLVALSATACGRQASPADGPVDSDQIIITNGTVLDGRGSEPLPDGVVVVTGGRITFVGKAADYPVPSDAQVIDALGGTILPGIVDAHVHSASDPSVRREFLMDGVTTVCDLGSPLEDMARFAEDHLEQAPAARGLKAGPILTAPGGLPGAVLERSLNYEVGTAEEAGAAVEDLSGRGADVIKVYVQEESGGTPYPMLGEDELTAIVEEAHKRGLPVRAHVTYAFLLDDAIRAGVDAIDHVPVNVTQTGSPIPESQLPAYFEDNFGRMIEAGIVLVPTLDRPYGQVYRSVDPIPGQREAVEKILELVGWFHRLGGVVGLGTDWNVGTGTPAGMPVDEMEMLLAAGLSPMDVIEAGTRVSAYVSGRGDELGTLEPGMLADVIVVDGDPLEDLPQAMSDVVLVIKNGEIALIGDGMLSMGD